MQAIFQRLGGKGVRLKNPNYLQTPIIYTSRHGRFEYHRNLREVINVPLENGNSHLFTRVPVVFIQQSIFLVNFDR